MLIYSPKYVKLGEQAGIFEVFYLQVISFMQLEEIIVKGLNDCIVFKAEESPEYNDHKTFFSRAAS